MPLGLWGKGKTYGTTLVDPARRQVVNLLLDRSAATLANWLKRRRGTGIIARDGSNK